MGLAHSRRAEKEECADRSVWILEPRPVSLDGAHDFLYGLVLTYDPALQPALHLHYPVALGLSHLVDRDSGHLGDHGGNVICINDIAALPVRGKIETDHRPSLVHGIYRLVRQRLVGDVAIGQTDACLYGVVTIGHIVETLVIRLQILQNRNGLLNVCRLHDNFLEPSVKGSVLLHDLGELVHGRCADALELASGQGRFKDVGGIQTSLRTASTDNRVKFVYEQDDVRICARLLYDGFQAFLEIATVLRTCDNRGYVQGNQTLLGKGRRDATSSDPQGYSLHDR